MNDPNKDIIEVQEAYANIYNEIVKPDRVFVATQYFRQEWLPLLGPSLAWVIMALRQRCYWSRETGEKRDWCLISQEELAGEIGISMATLKRLLKHKYTNKFIIDITHRYRYDSKRRKQVRKKSRYRIRMDDPLTPEDELLLKEKLAQKLSGLNIDPETGQMDMLQLLEQLSNTSLNDLQLNLSHRPNKQASNNVPVESSPSLDGLVEQVSKLLTGTNGQDRTSQSAEQENANLYPNAIHIPSNELRNFELATDQILIPWSGDYLAIPMIEVVKRDLKISGGRLSDQTRTECFYSVQDALGEGPPEEWLPEEESRINRMSQIERKLSEQYQQLGAFTLEEALQQYFNAQLTTRFLDAARESPAELERIRGWVIYTRQAKGLKNPGGFLRSRLESGELPSSLEEQTYSSK